VGAFVGYRYVSALIAAAALLVAYVWMLAPSSVLAHAAYESSTPADGEVLAESPERVEAFFSQEMARSGGLPTLIVVNEAGDQVDLGATLDDEDRTHLFVELAPELPDGRYPVIWHTLSDEDGEEAQGAFHFFVGDGPGDGPSVTPEPNGGTGTATPAPTDPPRESDEDSDGVSVWLLVAGVAAGLVIGCGAGMVLGRRTTA
jgi:copper transport protein